MPFDAASDDNDDDDDGQLIPFTDVLFGLVAIVIPAIAVMLPMMRLAADAVPARDGQAAIAFIGRELTVGGRAAETFVATGKGLRVRSDGDRLVGVDAILDDAQLMRALERLKRIEQPLLLLIEPDGQEAAFLFESVAASYGPERMFQVRLDPACGFVRDASVHEKCVAQTLAGAATR